MTDERRYKIQELVTTGWEDMAEDDSFNLTREECSARLKLYVEAGIAPNRLRAENYDPT